MTKTKEGMATSTAAALLGNPAPYHGYAPGPAPLLHPVHAGHPAPGYYAGSYAPPPGVMMVPPGAAAPPVLGTTKRTWSGVPGEVILKEDGQQYFQFMCNFNLFGNKL